jgi:hypothetical protein
LHTIKPRTTKGSNAADDGCKSLRDASMVVRASARLRNTGSLRHFVAQTAIDPDFHFLSEVPI